MALVAQRFRRRIAQVRASGGDPMQQWRQLTEDQQLVEQWTGSSAELRQQLLEAAAAAQGRSYEKQGEEEQGGSSSDRPSRAVSPEQAARRLDELEQRLAGLQVRRLEGLTGGGQQQGAGGGDRAEPEGRMAPHRRAIAAALEGGCDAELFLLASRGARMAGRRLATAKVLLGRAVEGVVQVRGDGSRVMAPREEYWLQREEGSEAHASDADGSDTDNSSSSSSSIGSSSSPDLPGWFVALYNMQHAPHKMDRFTGARLAAMLGEPGRAAVLRAAVDMLHPGQEQELTATLVPSTRHGTLGALVGAAALWLPCGCGCCGAVPCGCCGAVPDLCMPLCCGSWA